MKTPLSRLLKVPTRSFFLFGPRGVGKSTWLKSEVKAKATINLLESSTFLELSRNPSILEAKIGKLPAGSWIWIDEVQKIPQVLDEVHRLMEEHRWKFALSGSSARKLKRGGANLLGGRAITRIMESFSFYELGNEFELKNALDWGTLPLVALNQKDARDILQAYVHTYIKEEIKEEGLVRKLEPFIRFLEIAGIMNGQLVNADNIAREAKIPRANVDVYFSILEDTLLGHLLPSYRPKAKVREGSHPKFYWFDPGVARGAAGLLNDPVDGLWYGTALETLIFHELRVYNHTSQKERTIAFYRTGSGVEIDFIIETKKRTVSSKPSAICIEVKYSKRWDRKWEAPMRSLKASGQVKVEKMFGVYMGADRYHFDGVDVLPVAHFLKLLYANKVF